MIVSGPNVRGCYGTHLYRKWVTIVAMAMKDVVAAPALAPPLLLVLRPTFGAGVVLRGYTPRKTSLREEKKNEK